MTCASYDHIEMACMFHYDVILTTKEGETVEGKAVTTKSVDKVEHLVLAHHDQELLLPLDSLVKMVVTTKEARFTEVLLG